MRKSIKLHRLSSIRLERTTKGIEKISLKGRNSVRRRQRLVELRVVGLPLTAKGRGPTRRDTEETEIGEMTIKVQISPRTKPKFIPMMFLHKR